VAVRVAFAWIQVVFANAGPKVLKGLPAVESAVKPEVGSIGAGSVLLHRGFKWLSNFLPAPSGATRPRCGAAAGVAPGNGVLAWAALHLNAAAPELFRAQLPVALDGLPGNGIWQKKN
jgi:hypothetical protein